MYKVNSTTHLLNKANNEFNNDNLELSKEILFEILSKEHRNIAALQLLGIIYALEKNYDKSIEFFTKAIKLSPINAQLLFNRGNALNDFGKHEHARMDLEKSLLLDSKNIKTLVAYGNACKRCGDLEKARDSYDKALRINPHFYEAKLNKACLLQDSSDYENAILLFESAINSSPQYPHAYFNLGTLLQNLNRLDAALLNYDKAIAIMPKYIDAYINRGNILRELGQLEEAIICFDKVIAINPSSADAFNNRGIVYDELKKYEDAISNYDQAISLSPFFADAHMNKGNTLRKVKKLEEAILCFKNVVEIEKDNVDAYINLGNSLKELKRIDESIEAYDKAIFINPNFAEAYFNKSLAYLLLGNFNEGWKFYEWRWRQVKPFSPKRCLEQKRFWDGSKLNGILLVLPEQGVGDEILYLGILNDVKNQVDRLIVAVDKRLVSICNRSFENISFVSVDEVDKNFNCDAQIYMGSLGQYFRNDKKCFQNVRTGYLKADRFKTNEIRKKLTINNKIICGISWASANKEFGDNKSISIIDLIPLFSFQNMHFVDLQYGDARDELQLLFERTGASIVDMENIDKFNDIDGLASLIDACDVIVTVSNTTAHLAAALGKPVFIILPQGHGLLYYWQIDRHDSPWYPSVKLYRPNIIGSIDDTLLQISNDINNLNSS